MALTIGDAVSITAGEPVAAARLLVSRARDRRDLHFTEAPGDSEATDEETSAVAEHDAKDAQSAVAEAEFEDGRPPTSARGWRKETRNTAPPAVAGEEKPPLKMPHSQTGKMWATSATFSGIGDGERHTWAEWYKSISTPTSTTRPDHWLE